MAVRYNGEIVTLASGPPVEGVTGDSWDIEGEATAELRLTELDRIDPAGRFRLRVSGDVMTVERALTAEWATSTTILTFTGGASPSLQFDDNVALLFGTGSDVSLSYNGTDFIINPIAVGSGNVVVGSGEAGTTTATGAQIRSPDIVTGGAGNVAGTDLTFAPGLGTGIGDVGTLIFQTTRVASSGDNLQTVATLMTLDETLATISAAGGTGDVGLRIMNTSNAGDGEDASLLLSSGGTSAGDPFITFEIEGSVEIAGGDRWTIGIDNDGGHDRLIISASSAIGTNAVFRLDGFTDGTNNTSRILIPDLTITANDTATPVMRGFDIVTQTIAYSGTTTVTSLQSVVFIGKPNITQTGGAIIINKSTTMYIEGPPNPNTSVTASYISTLRLGDFASGSGTVTQEAILAIESTATTSWAIDVNVDGSDQDVLILHVDVTGNPIWAWDESVDVFTLSHGLNMQAGTMILGSGEGGVTAGTGLTLRSSDIAAGGAGNLAGTDLTIAAGLGTGTGDVGTIIFQTPKVAATGDNIQSLTTLLTLDAHTAIISSAAGTADVGFSVLNTSNSADGEDAFILISSGGATAGDAFIAFEIQGSDKIAGADRWSVGIDNTNGHDQLNFAAAGTPTSSVILRMDGFSGAVSSLFQFSIPGSVTLKATNVATPNLLSFEVRSPTIEYAGQTGVTSLQSNSVFGQADITQAGGAIAVNKSTTVLVAGPPAPNTSVTISHTSSIRLGAIGAFNGTATLVAGLAFEGATTWTHLIDANVGGGDRDVPLLHIEVDGDPTLSWDESDDEFELNKGLEITSGQLRVGLAGTAGGSVTVAAGLMIGADSTNNLLDDATNGSSTTTMFVGNASITVSSDSRAKRDITQWEGSAANLLRQARLVEYNYDMPGGGASDGYGPNGRGRYLGMLAQETIEWAPWIVNAGEAADCQVCLSGSPCTLHTHLWHVEYEHLVPLVIAGWQEHDMQIEALERRVAELEAQLG